MVSSPAPRAAETAALIGARFDQPVRFVDDLGEHRGRRMPVEQVAELEQRITDFFARPNELVFGEETAHQTEARLRAALDDLTHETSGTVVAVSHRTIIVAFVAGRITREPMALWRRLDAPSFVVLSLPDYSVLEIRESV